MHYLYLLIDAIAVLLLLFLGVIVLFRERSSKTGLVFVGFIASVSVWIVSNYISNDTTNSPELAHVANYFVFSCSYLASIFLLYLTIHLTGNRRAQRIFSKLHFVVWPISLLFGSSLTVKGVVLQEDVYAVTFGPAIALYGVLLIGALTLAVMLLRKAYPKAHGVNRGRLRSLYISMVLSLPPLLILQFIIPAVTGWFALTNVGVLCFLGVVYGLYYSAIKHRLFGIRPAIARSMAFVTSALIVTASYSVISYYLTFRLVHDNIPLQLTISTLLFIFAIVLYQPLQQYLKKITYRFLFQDSYDSQQVYTEFNRIIISTIDLENLLNTVCTYVAKALNLESCSVVFHANGKLNGTVTSDSSIHLPSYSQICKSDSQKDVVLVSRLENDSHLREIFDECNIACVLPLPTHNPNHGYDGVFGYILAAEKRSGYPYNSDDTTVLSAIATELAVAIQNCLQYEEIQKFNATLEQKVEDATRKLRVTNEKLKKLDETKDEFVSMASHQLRTPLTSVKGYLSMVIEGDAGPLNAQQEDLLKQSYMSSQRMVNLIADLLNLSRLSTGKFVIDSTPTDLRVIVDQEVAGLRETAKAKHIELTWDMPKTFSLLPLDENKIHQVVMNFVDNALYYTPEGGKVEVTLIETPKAVEFRVKDTGIGVPRELQRHLFTKFYRADNARRMRPDGTGLGLYMAKKVVVAQGGSVIFESQEGKGSVFGFRFRKQPVAPVNVEVA